MHLVGSQTKTGDLFLVMYQRSFSSIFIHVRVVLKSILKLVGPFSVLVIQLVIILLL